MEHDVRTRILEGTYACVAAQGIARTSLADAARVAGVSRATLYRYFPGGRDELIGAVIGFEVVRFFMRLAETVQDADDLEQLLVDGIVFAHRAIEEHEVLQRVLATEPELVVPRLTLESRNLIELICGFLVPRIAASRLPRRNGDSGGRRLCGPDGAVVHRLAGPLGPLGPDTGAYSRRQRAPRRSPTRIGPGVAPLCVIPL